MRDLQIDSTNLFVKGLTQLFIDNVVIESVQDITRRWHTPERRKKSPVIKKDKPWEHVTYFTYSNYAVLFDEKDRLFKCWYEDLKPVPDLNSRHYSCQLYAESADGIHWKKPELDVSPVDGRKTNIVLGGGDFGEAHSMSVVIDKHPRHPEERFRAVFTRMWNVEKESKERIECAHSPDGIHWKPYAELPRFGMSGPKLNDVSVLFYDEDSREFVQNTRHFLQWGGGINLRNPRTNSMLGPVEPHNPLAYNQRRIWQTRSHDFIHWSELVPVAATDDYEDNLDESYYGMAQFKVGTLHLATAGVLRAVDNEMDVRLLCSRDGIRWQTTNKRQPFLAPRGEGYWDAYMVSLVSPPIEVEDKLYFFHGGTSSHHDWWLCPQEQLDLPKSDKAENVTYGLGLATLRKDGFAGLYANRLREGIIVTRPLISLGTKLIINAKCAPGGSIRVEIVNRLDEAVGNCTKENCDSFAGDSTSHIVTWQGNPAIPSGRDGRLYWRKIRFFLRDAELFSFRFADETE